MVIRRGLLYVLLVFLGATLVGADTEFLAAGEFTLINAAASERGFIGMYDLGTNKWTKLFEVPRNSTHRAVYGQIGDVIYFGGPSSFVLNDAIVTGLVAYDTQSDTRYSISGSPREGLIKALLIKDSDVFVGGTFKTLSSTDGKTCVGLAKFVPSSATWEFVATPPASVNEVVALELFPGSNTLMVGWAGSNNLYRLNVATQEWSQVALLNGVPEQILSCGSMVYVRTSAGGLYSCAETTCESKKTDASPVELGCYLNANALYVATATTVFAFDQPESFLGAVSLVDGGDSLSEDTTRPRFQTLQYIAWSGYDKGLLMAGLFTASLPNSNQPTQQVLRFTAGVALSTNTGGTIALPNFAAPAQSVGRWFATASPRNLLFGNFQPLPTSAAASEPVFSFLPGDRVPAGVAPLTLTTSSGTPTLATRSVEALKVPLAGLFPLVLTSSKDLRGGTVLSQFYDSRTNIVALVTGHAAETRLILFPYNETLASPLDSPVLVNVLYGVRYSQVEMARSATGLLYVMPLDTHPRAVSMTLVELPTANPAQAVTASIPLPNEAMCPDDQSTCRVTAMAAWGDGVVVSVSQHSSQARLYRFLESERRWARFPNAPLAQAGAADFTASHSPHSIVNALTVDEAGNLFVGGAFQRTLPSGELQYALAAFDPSGADIPLAGWTAATREAFAAGQSLLVYLTALSGSGATARVALAAMVAGEGESLQDRMLVANLGASKAQAFPIGGPNVGSAPSVFDLHMEPDTCNVLYAGRFTHVAGSVTPHLALFSYSATEAAWSLAALPNAYPDAAPHALSPVVRAPLNCSLLTSCAQCAADAGCVWCRDRYYAALEKGTCQPISTAYSHWSAASEYDLHAFCHTEPAQCVPEPPFSWPWWATMACTLSALGISGPFTYLCLGFCRKARKARRERYLTLAQQSAAAPLPPKPIQNY
ncbi:hypothetical protein PAPYR_5575 [Paratrimastix pyriformis]|uniref:Uncharacterized protein n=1 Tax=Paratrimastix pyriformis TaxID=342808 RepID=A0ABQ8UHA3_9EUKA|nr:hypothetical protein PAPYR_5575 [Paratrimastix pyriformis]